jgi:hypothetical protein
MNITTIKIIIIKLKWKALTKDNGLSLAWVERRDSILLIKFKDVFVKMCDLSEISFPITRTIFN